MTRIPSPRYPRQILAKAGLRPTRQRLALARLLFGNGTDRHVTAEQLHHEAQEAGVPLSVATVYNTLHQLVAAGLVRAVVVDAARSYFDTNTTEHGHFFRERTGELHDIDVVVGDLPEPPEGARISRVDVVVRLAED